MQICLAGIIRLSQDQDLSQSMQENDGNYLDGSYQAGYKVIFSKEFLASYSQFCPRNTGLTYPDMSLVIRYNIHAGNEMIKLNLN